MTSEQRTRTLDVGRLRRHRIRRAPGRRVPRTQRAGRYPHRLAGRSIDRLERVRAETGSGRGGLAASAGGREGRAVVARSRRRHPRGRDHRRAVRKVRAAARRSVRGSGNRLRRPHRGDALRAGEHRPLPRQGRREWRPNRPTRADSTRSLRISAYTCCTGASRRTVPVTSPTPRWWSLDAWRRQRRHHRFVADPTRCHQARCRAAPDHRLAVLAQPGSGRRNRISAASPTWPSCAGRTSGRGWRDGRHPSSWARTTRGWSAAPTPSPATHTANTSGTAR